MRKKLFALFAAIGLLATTNSCSDEINIEQSGKDGDLVKVTFTLTRENDAVSRAAADGQDGLVHYPGEGEHPQISDGSKAKRLIWAVYDKDGNLLPELGNGYASTPGVDKGNGQVVEDIERFPHTITITLVRGQQYSFAFWAQDENCKAFDTEDLRAVKVDYKGTGNNIANDELRDAFCKVETFTVTSAASMERTIILKRPFAQINVGIPASEYEALRQSGVRIAKSKIHMENVATEFDVVANSTHGDVADKRQAIDYDANFIPAYYNFNVSEGNYPTDEELEKGRADGQTQDLKIDLNHDGKIAPYGKKNGDGADALDETFNYMLMAYILPADRNDGTSTYSTTLDKVEFSLIPEDSGQAPLSFALENVPVQRNWRTNIFGSMFTSEVVLKIDLDPFYAGDYNYPSWERIYEGVTYDAIEECIRISNGAGLAWLSNATNGVWPTQDEFEADKTHDLNASANLKNSGSLMLKAAGLDKWPTDGLFHFTDVAIKLDADIDMYTYANIFNVSDYFTPIGLSDLDAQKENLENETCAFFGGHFDGQNHTIYNLKCKANDVNDGSSIGLFSTIGRNCQIENIRLKDVDLQGHYCVGGIVGRIYSSFSSGGYEDGKDVGVFNCYVDGGNIISTSMERNGKYDEANNIGGIVGLFYNSGTIADCFVRNVNLRAYRAVSGIVGQVGGDYQGALRMYGNKVYDVNIIVDQFQEYGSEEPMQVKNQFLGKDFYSNMRYSKDGSATEAPGENETNNVKVYAFTHFTENGKRYTNIGVSDLLSNPPLDIFPRLVKYTDIIQLQTSILGGPSAYKAYENDDENWKGTPISNSGRVGMYISGVTLDGDTDGNPTTIDNHTVTASGVNGDNDCVLFIKDAATVKNLTLHGATYAGQAICLEPNGEIVLENVLAYDAKKVLTDGGNGNKATLTVTGSNFRGYVSLSDGYGTITFDNTVFDGSTKRADETINRLELGSTATLTNCTFIAPFEIEANGSKFENCVWIEIADGVTTKYKMDENGNKTDEKISEEVTQP